MPFSSPILSFPKSAAVHSFSLPFPTFSLRLLYHLTSVPLHLIFLSLYVTSSVYLQPIRSPLCKSFCYSHRALSDPQSLSSFYLQSLFCISISHSYNRVPLFSIQGHSSSPLHRLLLSCSSSPLFLYPCQLSNILCPPPLSVYRHSPPPLHHLSLQYEIMNHLSCCFCGRKGNSLKYTCKARFANACVFDMLSLHRSMHNTFLTIYTALLSLANIVGVCNYNHLNPHCGETNICSRP